MEPRYPIIVPTTATQEVQDSSRMVVDLRLKTIVKDNYGIVGRAASEAELLAADMWQQSVNMEIDERSRHVKPKPPANELVCAIADIAGHHNLLSDASDMLDHALSEGTPEHIRAAARLVAHHLRTARFELRSASDKHLQTDFDSDIPF